MAYTYHWEVTGLRKAQTDELEGIIIGTNWKVTGVDEDGYSGSFTGATPFKLEEVNPNNFIEWGNLTETQVLGWIKSKVSGSSPTSYWSHIDEQIDKAVRQVKHVITRVETAELPWGTGSKDVTPMPTAHLNRD
jgi:hypothetical protein